MENNFSEEEIAAAGKWMSRRLIDWYLEHKRDLPWRETRDPYIIWISEIILQQTRVAQGMDYFHRFIRRFPDVSSLAAAAEDEVLKYWQGLGYYSRARNLHAAARMIEEQHNGRFPESYPEVLALKGVGEYTAAAIVSAAWNAPYPVVDGNVFRVLSRLFALDTPIDSGKGKKAFTRLAGWLMDPAEARLYNQAMMEFGALQCTPKNPDCRQCVLADKCLAYASGEVQAYPVKQHKTKTRDRYFHYFHILSGNRTWLHRRTGKDIWAGLYEFPLIETEGPVDFAELQKTEAFQSLFGAAGHLRITVEQPKEKHILSHQVLYITFYRIEIEKVPESLQTYLPVAAETLEEYAVPRIIHIYLEKWLGKLEE
ncbi:A/G-specific adenine glycosylase [Parabacteroides sp. PF5-6]|uniref:A/G-specific adenine glycosylase n=1 Tax=Parabacteroides sp. PF5-6 TaxID=1742403 RepID=UPI002405B290|nr:A/G-specific adenine glycosylase [Parabacteroides sp. PF5-6]MDF9830171.1 A/G-specific adenine glycosylase [Parabacteroides sp. PF5-6]